VHFWARRMKPRLEEKENNRPRRGSFMDKVMRKHGIDPDAALIPAKKKTAKAPVTDPEFQAKVAIESLKGEASVEKLSRDFLVETGQIKQWRTQLIEGAPRLFREG
jgi:hypothetical protein